MFDSFVRLVIQPVPRKRSHFVLSMTYQSDMFITISLSLPFLPKKNDSDIQIFKNKTHSHKLDDGKQ